MACDVIDVEQLLEGDHPTAIAVQELERHPDKRNTPLGHRTTQLPQELVDRHRQLAGPIPVEHVHQLVHLRLGHPQAVDLQPLLELLPAQVFVPIVVHDAEDAGQTTEAPRAPTGVQLLPHHVHGRDAQLPEGLQGLQHPLPLNLLGGVYHDLPHVVVDVARLLPVQLQEMACLHRGLELVAVVCLVDGRVVERLAVQALGHPGPVRILEVKPAGVGVLDEDLLGGHGIVQSVAPVTHVLVGPPRQQPGLGLRVPIPVEGVHGHGVARGHLLEGRPVWMLLGPKVRLVAGLHGVHVLVHGVLHRVLDPHLLLLVDVQGPGVQLLDRVGVLLGLAVEAALGRVPEGEPGPPGGLRGVRLPPLQERPLDLPRLDGAGPAHGLH
mmetsp:Transcript_142504/g.248596  ORF Transcript_142504/g.248596 Transcript_142504/m.248596 type:complete len:381 (+) Transcript_142504:1145-2287(+)